MTFDIQGLRHSVANGERPLRLTTHAHVEAFKEGLQLADLRRVFETGKVIEEYEGGRALVYGWAQTVYLPIHLVIEAAPEEIVLVTPMCLTILSGPDIVGVDGVRPERHERAQEQGQSMLPLRG